MYETRGRVNSCGHCINGSSDLFLIKPGVSDYNIKLGKRNRWVRKRSAKVDRSFLTDSEKSVYIYTKRNVDGLRR
jgi:hypothetical protein